MNQQGKATLTERHYTHTHTTFFLHNVIKKCIYIEKVMNGLQSEKQNTSK